MREVIGEMPLLKREEDEEEAPVESRGLRFFLINDSIFGGVFARSISKLLYKLRRSADFNRFATPILLVLCYLLRHYQANLYFADFNIIYKYLNDLNVLI